VESIHKRIKRLREAKGLSQEKLADLVGVAYQSVQEWERDNGTGTAPSRKRQAQVAKALGVTVRELLLGDRNVGLSAREELLLEMFNSFTPEQQREQMNYIRALYNANRITQPFVGKKLRTIGNEEVEVAFGKVPSPKRSPKKPTKHPGGRDSGAAMDDFLGE
jgi:transcriptional regulator with XRE-family HTH domain